MDKKSSMSIPIRTALYNPHLPLYNNQTDNPTATFEITPRGYSTSRRGNSLSSTTKHLDLTTKPLTLPSEKIATTSRHIKHQSLASPSLDLFNSKQREKFEMDHLLLDQVSPIVSAFNSRPITSNNSKKARYNNNIESQETPGSERKKEPLDEVLKKDFMKITDYAVKQHQEQQTRPEKRRTRSIALTPAHLDLSTIKLEIPISTTTRKSSTSQAFTNAMKALQDRIRELEEQQAKSSREISEKHQVEMNELAKSERAQRERAEMWERQNMELSLRVRDLEEENSGLLKESKELLTKKAQIELKYEKMTKFHDVYEDIEGRVDVVQKRLDEALRNEGIAQQNMNETRHEREMLREKNMALTEALKNLEQEYEDCKKMYSEKFAELVAKNESLEKEIEIIKNSYSQQMQDFDHELTEIEKSHAVKVEEYEVTIAALKRKIVDIGDNFTLNNAAISPIPTSRLSNSNINNITPIEPIIQQPRFSALSQKSRESRHNNNNDFEDRRIDVSERQSYSRLSPLSLHAESGFTRNDYMPRVSLKVNTNIKNSAHKENLNISGSVSARNRHSPEKVNRSSALNEKIISQTSMASMTARNRNGYLDVSDLVNKENSSRTTFPTPRNTGNELHTYLSPGVKKSRFSPSPDKKSTINYSGHFQSFPVSKNDSLEHRESTTGNRNLSFGNQEVQRDTLKEAKPIKKHVRNTSLKDSSALLIRQHREDLLDSVRDSSRSKRSQAAEVIEGKISAREKELKKINDEYQGLMKKTMESQDPRERSKMRTHLIKLTEEIQKINEEIYKIKKESIGLKG